MTVNQLKLKYLICNPHVNINSVAASVTWFGEVNFHDYSQGSSHSNGSFFSPCFLSSDSSVKLKKCRVRANFMINEIINTGKKTLCVINSWNKIEKKTLTWIAIKHFHKEIKVLPRSEVDQFHIIKVYPGARKTRHNKIFSTNEIFLFSVIVCSLWKFQTESNSIFGSKCCCVRKRSY